MRTLNTFWMAVLGNMAALGLVGCSSAHKNDYRSELRSEFQSENETLKREVQDLKAKLAEVSQSFVLLNEKMDGMSTSLENYFQVKKKRTQPAIPVTHAQTGTPIEHSNRAKNDPSGNLGNELAIQLYREALIVFESGDYPAAILKFSDFIKKYPDHTLAGSAQYFVAESYFQQKESELALREFEKLLLQYDRSSHLPEALGRLVEIETQLKLPEKAEKHQQILLSVFPQSPVAQKITDTAIATKFSDSPKPRPEVAETVPTTPVPSPNDTHSESLKAEPSEHEKQ